MVQLAPCYLFEVFVKQLEICVRFLDLSLLCFPFRFKGVHHLQKVMEAELAKLERNRNDQEVLVIITEGSENKL